MQLHRDESVIFAGYLLPHPLVYDVEVGTPLEMCDIYSPCLIMANQTMVFV
jgi:hypothetical protein